MIDFHSHILPKMDDGSKSIEQSIKMLHLSKAQGIDIICATSHYYPTHESPEHFLERRKKAFNDLQQYLDDDCPTVLLGAEVQYFEGMKNVESLKSLRIEGSELLLIEMPFSKWTARMIEDILKINSLNGIQVVLAHVERYEKYVDKDVLRQLANKGIILQSNAEYFLSGFFEKRKAIKLLEEKVIRVLGSDCHNLDSRKPNLSDALKEIEKRLSKEFVNELNSYGHKLLNRY